MARELTYFITELLTVGAYEESLLERVKSVCNELYDSGQGGFLDQIHNKYGDFVAIADITVMGLQGHDVGFLNRIFGNGKALQLLIAKQALIFFIPEFNEKAESIVIEFDTIQRLKNNFLVAGDMITIYTTDKQKIICMTEGQKAGAISNIIQVTMDGLNY